MKSNTKYVHFELSKQKKFLESRRFINLIGIGIVAVLVFGVALFDIQGNFKIDPFGLFFILAFALALFIFLKKQKSIKEFDVDEVGIRTAKKTYTWAEMKKFHLLGESQSERFGTTRYVDMLNPYKNTETQIFRIKTRKLINAWINLEVDKERVDEFNDILVSHDVIRSSKWRLYLGV